MAHGHPPPEYRITGNVSYKIGKRQFGRNGARIEVVTGMGATVIGPAATDGSVGNSTDILQWSHGRETVPRNLIPRLPFPALRSYAPFEWVP